MTFLPKIARGEEERREDILTIISKLRGGIPYTDIGREYQFVFSRYGYEKKKGRRRRVKQSSGRGEDIYIINEGYHGTR